MIVIDTSIWIEYFKNHEPYSSLVSYELENRNVLAVECVFGEILQGCRSQSEINMVKGHYDNLPKINDQNLWVEAGLYSSKNKLFSKGVGLIDTVILLAARKEKAFIWTLDKKLLSIMLDREKYS